MPTLSELFGFILLVVVTLTGLAGNGFIAIVNCIDWFRSRKLSPADMILSCLNLFPFMIFLFSSILLLTSLWRHKNLLRNTAKDVSTEAHLNAIKALASFCILYVSSFFVEILNAVLSWMDTVDLWVRIFFFNVIAAYSSGHAIILIFINPRLKQESVRILHQLKSCMKTPS
uniref:taste receptor type 2 member 1-like n=1 Tax=Podarcis muralis TaxID=64176 RepID=UPI0010A0AD4B|nr:taste receptor type 2 member 1-like [Podarcis muralis]